MQKLTLTCAISAVSATVAPPALATPVTANDVFYTTVATSARNAITVLASRSVSVYYVDDANAGTASDPSKMPPDQQPVDLVRSGDWLINLASGAFSGAIAYGNFKTQTNVGGTPALDGRQTFVGVTQSVSGTGTWVTATHLTYSYFNTTVAGGGASTMTQTSASCANGTTSLLGKVCTTCTGVTPNWEGIALDLYFSASYDQFSGTLTATDTSGTGLTRNTVTIVWSLDGTDPPFPSQIPLPATAWLFGSALVGLSTRRRAGTRKLHGAV